MFFGAPFVLAPPVPAARSWSSLSRIVHLAHNPQFLISSEKALHCVYFALLFADKWLSMKLYSLVALPIALLIVITWKGE